MLNKSHLSVLIHEQAKKYGAKTALKYRDYALNKWTPISWNDFSLQVNKVERALMTLGVEPQERIAVFSQNKPECLYVSFGGYGVRAVTIPFYATSSGAQASYMLNDAAVRYLFVGEQAQYDIAVSVVGLCQKLEKIIIFDSAVKKKATDHFSIYFDEFLQLGSEKMQDEVEKRHAEASFSDMADILYTSGTTGNSKGVILTYDMYLHGIMANDECLNLGEQDIILSFLPYTHIFERAWSYLGLSEGACLAVNLRPTEILRSLREVRPTCMSSVPRFWEKVYQGVQQKIAESNPLQRTFLRNALSVGVRYWTMYASQQKEAPLSLKLKYKFYDKTVYKLLRKTLGLDRANFFPTAGAAISKDIENFAHAVGIYMMAGYGLTESTATVSNDHVGKRNTPGSVGRVINGLEVKIGENEEILLRGKTIFPGYFKKVSATKSAIDEDGWFHTGDAGYIKNGELFLKERIKDLYKTSNGKYIAPQMIESKLTIDRYIDQCVIIANQRKFVSALIVPDYKLLREYAEENGCLIENDQQLCQHPLVVKFFTERIDTLQQDLAGYEKIKSFLLLPEPFTIENGELTNTLKVKRNVVCQRYADVIDRLYEDAEKKFSAN